MGTRAVSKVANHAATGGDDSTRQQLATPAEVADYLRESTQGLANRRHRGNGPAFVRIGGNVRYRWSDVDAWLEQNTRTQTG